MAKNQESVKPVEYETDPAKMMTTMTRKSIEPSEKPSEYDTDPTEEEDNDDEASSESDSESAPTQIVKMSSLSSSVPAAANKLLPQSASKPKQPEPSSSLEGESDSESESDSEPAPTQIAKTPPLSSDAANKLLPQYASKPEFASLLLEQDTIRLRLKYVFLINAGTNNFIRNDPTVGSNCNDLTGQGLSGTTCLSCSPKFNGDVSTGYMKTGMGLSTYFYVSGCGSGLCPFFYLFTIDETIEKDLGELDDFVRMGVRQSTRWISRRLYFRHSKIYKHFISTALNMRKLAGILVNGFDAFEVRAKKALKISRIDTAAYQNLW